MKRRPKIRPCRTHDRTRRFDFALCETRSRLRFPRQRGAVFDFLEFPRVGTVQPCDRVVVLSVGAVLAAELSRDCHGHALRSKDFCCHIIVLTNCIEDECLRVSFQFC